MRDLYYRFCTFYFEWGGKLDIYFSNRELLILDYLKKNKYVTSEELANYLSVSKRTVKKDISRIKENINQEKILLKSYPAKGYLLDSSFIFSSEELTLSRDKDLILNNYDRVAYLVQRLLLSEGAIRYEDLADELYISPSSLSKDMKKVRALFSEYKLKVSHRPNYGVEVMGSEFHKRLAISNFFFHSFLSYLSNYKQTMYKKDSAILQYLEKIINEVSNNYEISLSKSSINDLAIQIVILFSRQKFEKDLEMNKKIMDKNSYEASSEIINRVKSFFDVEIIEEQSIYFFYTHITNKKIISHLSPAIKDRVLCIVNEIMNEIYINFDLDFSEDDALSELLALHIEQLYRRVKNDLAIQNPFIFQHFRDYLFASKITISATRIIEKKLTKKPIPLDEYGYLILYFQYALNNIKKKPSKIILYTGNNRSEKLSYESILKNTLNKEVYEIIYIDSLDNIKNDFDLLVSTVSLNKEMFGEKSAISNVTKETLLNIENFLRNPNNSRRILQNYINEDSVFVSKATTKKGIERDILNYLRNKNYLKEKTNRKLAYHEVGNGLIHIQDIDKIIKKRLCLVVVLKHPILWEKIVVKTLFLIKTKKDGDKDLNYLCGVFSDWTNNPDAVQYVYEQASFEALLKTLNNQKNKFL